MKKKSWLIIIIALIITLVSKQLFAVKQYQQCLEQNIITLDFKKIAVKELLQFIAESMNFNIIMSESVAGTLTLHLHDTTWQQTLNIVLEMTGLVKKQKDNTLMIATSSEFALRQKNLSDIQPLKNIYLKLHHADATQVVTILKSQNDILSSAAKITVNAQDNSLWIKENLENIPILIHYLHQIDISEKQILITAKIVNIDDNKLKELGIKFNSSSKNGSSKNLHVDLPENNSNKFEFTIATIAQNQLLDLELDALESTGHSKVIANPKLITQNRKPATIEAGEEIPYQEKTSSGATSTTFKKAALCLKVTPTILPDARIILDLEINQNKTSVLAINGTPAIQTQELKTQVIISDGQTVILGGIFEKSNAEVINKFPILGELPLLGRLFNHENTQIARKELLIIVNPRIL